MLKLSEVNSDWGKIAAGLILCDEDHSNTHTSLVRRIYGLQQIPLHSTRSPTK